MSLLAWLTWSKMTLLSCSRWWCPVPPLSSCALVASSKDGSCSSLFWLFAFCHQIIWSDISPPLSHTPSMGIVTPINVKCQCYLRTPGEALSPSSPGWSWTSPSPPWRSPVSLTPPWPCWSPRPCPAPAGAWCQARGPGTGQGPARGTSAEAAPCWAARTQRPGDQSDLTHDTQSGASQEQVRGNKISLPRKPMCPGPGKKSAGWPENLPPYPKSPNGAPKNLGNIPCDNCFILLSFDLLFWNHT